MTNKGWCVVKHQTNKLPEIALMLLQTILKPVPADRLKLSWTVTVSQSDSALATFSDRLFNTIKSMIDFPILTKLEPVML